MNGAETACLQVPATVTESDRIRIGLPFPSVVSVRLAQAGSRGVTVGREEFDVLGPGDVGVGVRRRAPRRVGAARGFAGALVGQLARRTLSSTSYLPVYWFSCSSPQSSIHVCTRVERSHVGPSGKLK